MGKRTRGFYWVVRVHSAVPEVAEWSGGRWYRSGSLVEYYGATMRVRKVLSERLVPPVVKRG